MEETLGSPEVPELMPPQLHLSHFWLPLGKVSAIQY